MGSRPAAGGTRGLTALDTRGIPRRPGGSRTVPPLAVDAATLTDLYLTRRLDDPAIGAQLGVPATFVLRGLLQ